MADDGSRRATYVPPASLSRMPWCVGLLAMVMP